MSDGQGQNDKLTLIVVPDEASPVRRYQISRVWLRRARWIGPLIGVALLALFADYARLRVNAVDMRRLRDEAKVRQVQVHELASTVQELDAQLTRIRELERKVRVIANLPELPSRKDAAPGSAPTALPGNSATAQKSVEAASPKARLKPKPKAKPKPKPKAKPKPPERKASPKAKPAPKPASTVKPAQKTAPKAKPSVKPAPASKPKPRPATIAEPQSKPSSSGQPTANDLGVPKPGEKPPAHLIIPRDEEPRVPAAPGDGQGGPERDAPAPGDEIPLEENPDVAPDGVLDDRSEEEAKAEEKSPIVVRKPAPGDDDVVRILGGAAIHGQLAAQAERLASELIARERSLDELLERLEGKSAQLASTPSIWPTSGWVTSSYGYRTSPFTGRRQFHSGIDIAANFGTPVVAPATGRVVFAGRKGAMGNMVEIDHGYGIHSIYGHLAEFFVKKGEFVERGQRIAAVGSTGRSTGPHLHYSVRLNRKHVNPANYIID